MPATVYLFENIGWNVPSNYSKKVLAGFPILLFK